jgi:outer membrane protein assembly factor BamB
MRSSCVAVRSVRHVILGLILVAILLGWVAERAAADDWPQWMGPQRDGVWRETGVLDKLPAGGPSVLWRTNVQRGYCGPAVVGDRLYLVDRQQGQAPERKPGERTLPVIPGNERVLCLDAKTGARIWEHAYECAYRISYPAGPRAMPLVAGGRVFTLGAMGDLLCLDARDGRVIWERHLLKEFTDEPPVWGFAAHPLLDGDRLICLVGGTNSAVVAFHKDTGKELWRALNAREIGYAPPVIYPIGDRRQLIVWHPDGVAGLLPETGRVLWTNAYPVGGKPQRPEVTIAMPRLAGSKLFLSSFYQGSMLLDLNGAQPAVVWNRRSKRKSEFEEGLHTTMCTPVIRDGHIYGVCGFGELRCLDLATGDRKWESFAPTEGKKSLFAQVFMIEQGGRYWMWNDQGELILATLSPRGYEEISRAKLLPTIEHTRGRDVLWCPPAFANRRAYVHNGQELICVSLADPDSTKPAPPAGAAPGA